MIALREALSKLAYMIKDTAADESEPDWIACHVLGCGRAALKLIRETDDESFEKMTAVAKERATGKPLCQIIGYTEFCGLKIRVNGDVLCPRLETELLVEQAILFLKDRKDARALDLCTGSGCIATALAVNTTAEVVASDISDKALAVAEENARRSGAKVKFVLSDVFEDVDGKFDIIVSNPPYIPSADIDGLGKRISFEPRTALDGGADGLDFYRRIAAEAEGYLTEDGVLLLEVGDGQAESVAAMFPAMRVETLSDMSGKRRIVVARKVQ